MRNFALLTHGSRGDIEPFIGLGRLLHDGGHQVTILTHSTYRAQVQAAGCDFVAVDDPAAYERHLRRTEDLVAPRPAEGMSGYYADPGLFYDRVSVAGGVEQVHREVLALVDIARGGGDRLVVVGRHTSSLSGLIAAELTGALVCLVALSPTQLITAPMAGLHLSRSAAGELNALRARLGLPEIKRWGQWLGTADLITGLWPEWFDAAGTPSPQPIELTDFSLADDTAGETDSATMAAAAELVDGAVLITGGSGRMLSPEFYPVAVAGVAESGRRAVLVTPHADLVPQPLPPSVVHVTRLPFAAVMPKAAAVVHHGGIGTLARALAAGVPQLLLAHGGDRPDNGHRLERLGLARSWTAETWGAEALAEALSHIDEGPAAGNATPAPMTAGGEKLVAKIEDWLAGLEDGNRHTHLVAR